MAIRKIKYYVIFLIMFFSCAHFASAGVIINEFVSNPNDGDKEWVELLNTDNELVNLTGWKLLDGNNINDDIDLNSKIIPANGVAIFENTKEGWLNNGDDTIFLKNNSSSTVDSVTYGSEGIINSPQKGKSGALISGNWITNQEPTKNLANSNTNVEENSDEEDDTTSTVTTSTSSDKETEPEIFKITTKIISPKIVTAGIPFSISSLTTTNTGKTYAVGRFVWNFGDGEMSEVGKAIPFDYVYEYPGEYVLSLSYFNSSLSDVADATNRITIKVVPAGLNISSVGDSTDPFIEIENKSSYEMTLSKWVITGGMHYFVIPEGTTILPNKKIKLSPKITGFVAEDIKHIIITNPNKEIFATYPIKKTQKGTYKSTSTSAIAQNDVSPLNKDSQIINLNDLGGSAGDAGVAIPKSAYAWAGLFVIIGLGVASFWFIKKRNNYDDYVDKEIRAEDMTIVE